MGRTERRLKNKNTVSKLKKAGMSQAQMDLIIHRQNSDFFYRFADQIIDDIQENFETIIFQVLRDNRVSKEKSEKIIKEIIERHKDTLEYKEEYNNLIK